ncbi:DNA-binding domain-containing protein [Ferrimonas kyonanensis]|uniref:HvfC family RiPP maturation protein n=1 Tax=Ferrimonas kyonanensis TaxID=364763 RepID=UPI00040874AB|nr:putative DNA-binding domain-containing protein [Ferrimonas kyonanensis]
MIDFKALQQEFMAHIRDPQQPAPQRVPAPRMAVYRELMLNNVGSFIDSGFPVLKSLYSESDWQALRERFFAHHDSHSPLFVDIAAEFLVYLDGLKQLQPNDPPYMRELAHYEYLELKLDVMPEAEHQQPLSVQDDLVTTPLLLNQVAEIGQYRYPVQHAAAHQRELEPVETLLLVYRNPELEIAFMAVNAMTVALLAQLSVDKPTTLAAIIEAMQQQFDQFAADVIEQGVIQMLGQLARCGVVVKPLG